MQESFQEVTMELCPSDRFASFQEKTAAEHTVESRSQFKIFKLRFLERF